VSMAHRKQSRHTTQTKEDRPYKTRHSIRHIEHLASDEHRYSGHTDPEQVQPRRRRWAAGYIDRPSCPSYAYINTRARSQNLEYSSDTESITPSRHKEDDHIEAHEQHNTYTRGRRSNLLDVRTWRHHSPLSQTDLQDRHPHSAEQQPYYASDIEELDHHRPHVQATATKRLNSDIEEGSDIVVVSQRDGGSDIASIHSRYSFSSRSDRHSIRSLSLQSDVQDTERRSSDSDDERGYISLDDYIASRSDCVSKHSLSEHEGEGSDAVGSDSEDDSGMGEGSDIAHGSDVASLSDDGRFDDEEDCIDDESLYSASRRRQP
jgi:hypothetical protein